MQSADKRAAALAAFDMVDAVTIFDEDTPQNLIAMLQPDFIVKGGDYKPDDVVGSDIVKKMGRQGGDCAHTCQLFNIKAC